MAVYNGAEVRFGRMEDTDGGYIRYTIAVCRCGGC